jgi:hypothetical protein
MRELFDSQFSQNFKRYLQNLNETNIKVFEGIVTGWSTFGYTPVMLKSPIKTHSPWWVSKLRDLREFSNELNNLEMKLSILFSLSF